MLLYAIRVAACYATPNFLPRLCRLRVDADCRAMLARRVYAARYARRARECR